MTFATIIDCIKSVGSVWGGRRAEARAAHQGMLEVLLHAQVASFDEEKTMAALAAIAMHPYPELNALAAEAVDAWKVAKGLARANMDPAERLHLASLRSRAAEASSAYTKAVRRKLCRWFWQR